jgi:hypothetical protein
MSEAIEPTLAKLMGDMPRLALSSMTDINTALIPVPKLEMDSYDRYARHHAELELQRRVAPRVVLIGDSITHFWAARRSNSTSTAGSDDSPLESCIQMGHPASERRDRKNPR